ncbi:MAG: DUF3857 domain-containing protein [Anaeromyxobacter sp.]
MHLRRLVPLAVALLLLPLAAAAADPTAEALARGTAALARDRRGPEGVAVFATLDGLEDDLPDLAPLAAAYAAAADDARAHPEVRALARFRLAGLARARGDLGEAEAHLARLGFVTRWQVIGPFDDEGKHGLEAVYPPEQKLDLAARVPGKTREVGWQPLPPELVDQGFVHLGVALRPEREVVAYALAIVEVPRDGQAVLWLGASGASKVWVNGQLALTDATYHLARLDQRGARVALRRGTNRLLVKLAHQEGRMGFYLRLDRGTGEGLAFTPGQPGARPVRPGARPRPAEDALAALTRRAQQARGPEAEARARGALSAALRERASGDLEERRALVQAQLAADAQPALVDAQLWAASLDDEHGTRRRRLDLALQAAPGDARVLVALAGEALGQERPLEAVRLLDRAAAAAPEWAVAQVARAEALARAGLEARSALAAAEVARRFPAVPGAQRAAARAAAALGQLDEAEARYRAALALRPDDGATRAALAQLRFDRRDLVEAEALAREGLRFRPGSLDLRLELAGRLAANGKPDEADALLGEALRLSPDDAEVLERRGRARLAAGRARDAQADLARALELAPQRPALKELLRTLEPAQERFEKPYLADAAALAAAAPAGRPDEDALILSELKVTRVLGSGLHSTVTQLVVKVLDARGVDDFRRQSVGWTPGRQEVTVQRARVIKPDGTSVESHDVRDRSTSEPWYRLYYDTAARTLSFPALAPGDVLELVWRVEDVAGENLLSDYFGDLTLVDGTARKARFDYVLLAPAARPIHAATPAGVAHAERALPGGVVEHRWTAAEVERLVPEPAMPGWSDVARLVHVSTYETWDEVNRFYWGLVRDQLRPGAELRAVARRLAAEALAARGAPPPALAADGAALVPPSDPALRRALVEAAYAFVVTQTRYVGLEFGIHGYKPYRVDQVLARRFGDCKDKASLLHALLEAMGIDSRLVLLRMRDLGGLPEHPASLAVFNHAILYVPELDLWLDGTASYSGPGDLPRADRGATVLVVNPSGPPRFGTLPEARPGENRQERRLEVALAADGAATVTGARTTAGVEAPMLRRAYEVEQERRTRLEQDLASTLSGVQVDEVKVSDLGRLADPVRIDFQVRVPRFAAREGEGLRFAPLATARGYAETLANLSARRYPLDLGGPRDDRLASRVALPAGWAVVELPPPASASGPLGEYQVTWRQEPGAVVAEAHVVLPRSRIAPADYPSFRELLIGLDRALQRRVRIAPATPAEARR